jgi:N-methylhydantoinase B
LEDGTTFSGRADSYKTSALGHRGGREGGNCRVVLNFATKEEQVMTPKQRLLTLKTGDSIRMETPGGGGFGKPNDRNKNSLMQDIIDGRITFETVKEFYGEQLLEEVKSLI